MSKHKSQAAIGSDDFTDGHYSTATLGANNKWIQDTRSTSYYQVGGTLTLDSVSGRTLNFTSAHGARQGDLVRFTSGDADRFEVPVYSVTDSDTLVIAEEIVDTSLAYAAADTAVILRPISQVVSSTGAFATEMSFTLNGSSQVVTEDTVTPANNRPLPVKLVSANGDLSITADNLDINLNSSEDSVEIIQDTHDDCNVNANLQVGDTDVANGNPVPISDAGGSLTVDNSVLTNLGATIDGNELQVDVVSSALPSGAATETTLDAIKTAVELIDNAVSGNELQVDIVAPLPSGTNTIGAFDVNHLDVVDQLDTPLLDASSVNIPASGSAVTSFVSSLAADVSAIQVFDTTGSFIGLYSDPTGSPVLEAIIGPGMDGVIPVSLASATELGLRNMENSAITSGNVVINFLG